MMQKAPGRIETMTAKAIRDLECMDASKRKRWAGEGEIAFIADASQARDDHATANLSIRNKIALNILQIDTTEKVGIQAQQKTAGWNDAYFPKPLMSILCKNQARLPSASKSYMIVMPLIVMDVGLGTMTANGMRLASVAD